MRGSPERRRPRAGGSRSRMCRRRSRGRPTSGEQESRLVRFPLAAIAAALVLTVAAPDLPARAVSGCASPRATPAYAGGVLRVLRSKRDIWGEQLLKQPGGPTYDAVRRLLKPLWFARARSKPLTDSGVYYLPFAQPLGSRGAHEIALHVADGSQILARTAATGASLRVMVGADGREPFGSCLT